MHIFTDRTFPSATWRLFYRACQRASLGRGRAPPTHHLPEAEGGASLRIKGYCGLKLLTGLRSLSCSTFVLSQRDLFLFILLSPPHSVDKNYAPLYKSLGFSVSLCALTRKGKRPLLHPCHFHFCDTSSDQTHLGTIFALWILFTHIL